MQRCEAQQHSGAGDMHGPCTPVAPAPHSSSTPTSQILETKVRKLEHLVKLKDAKIAALTSKLQVAGLV